METKYIFIIGVSRSGTTLMRKVLNSNSRVAICDENHFLGHPFPSEGVRYKFRKLGDLSNDDNVYKLVDYIYSGQFAKDAKYRPSISFQWTWMIRRIDQDELLKRILASDRSERALFAIMMQVFADRRGRPIMGEKTPAHLRYVPTLMEWFPNGLGKVIHMLRDPRGIFVSELRRRQKSAVSTPFKQLKRVGFLFRLFIIIEVTIMWLEGLMRYFRYKRLYPDYYYLLKFEDLVSDPEIHLEQLCDFLGIKFEHIMLEQKVVSEGFELGRKGFDAQAATRWKKYISPWENAWFVFCFGRYLKKFGYLDSQNKVAAELSEQVN